MSSDKQEGGSVGSKLLSGLTLPIAIIVITTLIGALAVRLMTPMNIVFLPAENTLYENVLTSASPSSEAQAHAVLASSFPSPCNVQIDPDSVYGDPNEIGPRSTRCREAIDASSGAPELAYRLLIALDATPVTGADIRDQAGSLSRSNNKDVDAWAHLPGGEIIQPLTRQRLSDYDRLSNTTLSIDQRRSIAHSIIGLKAQERTAISDFGDAIRQAVLGGTAQYLIGGQGALQAGGIAILAIIAITVIRRHSGWRRALAVLVTLCVVMAYVNVDTLSSLGLQESSGILGAEGLESIVGLPFVIVGQVIDFVAKSMAVSFTAKTFWTLAYLAVMIGVLTETSMLRVLALIYLSLLLPLWAAGQYQLFPYECDALSASIGLTLVIWVMKLVTIVAAALIGRCLWARYNRSLIAWGTEAFVVKAAKAAPVARSNQPDDVVLPETGA
jgi:hypothetical protein